VTSTKSFDCTPMKIAIIFDAQPEMGGAFHQSLNAIRQFTRVCDGLIDIQLFHLRKGGDIWLKELGHESNYLCETISTRMTERIIRSPLRHFDRKSRVVSPRERTILLSGAELIYFPSPSSFCLTLRVLNFISTIYDVCHREYPEFPEVGVSAIFERRERYNRTVLGRAVLTIADSEILKSKLCQMYGALAERILPMPFAFSHNTGSDGVSRASHMGSFSVTKTRYLFYPAQFWAHKNHIGILKALKILKDRGCSVDVTFAGGDRGGQANVVGAAQELGLVEQVRFLGLVSSEEVISLYKGALALIMPTYFGPTNIPPLEAWSLGVPVIYSNHLSSGIEDGVLPIDPDCPMSIANAIERVMQDSTRRELIVGGRRCLARAKAQADKSEEALRQHLVRFFQRRHLGKNALEL
jgi:glycosyltransferase involved in cell wall biosynthesis